MLTKVFSPTIDRAQVVKALTTIRAEWERATDGLSLMEVEGNVGLILGDIVLALELSSQEQRAVLGDELRQDFMRALRAKSSVVE